MEAAPSLYDVGADAVAAAVQGAFLGQQINGTYRLFAGTSTKLYEKTSATAWTDRSVGAGTYTASSEWSFCQFGDYTIATNLSDSMQVSTATAFANITGPKAKIVESVVTSGGGFVFAFNIVDGTWGTFNDGWWCSSLNDHATWTVSAATQCTRGRLLGAGGPIIAAKRFGQDQIVAYKNTSLAIGRYVGGDVVWQWSDIQTVGAVGPRAVCDIGYAHFIVASDGFWLFDGARPQRIGAEVRDWFLSNADFANLMYAEAVYDPVNNRVLVFFRKNGGSGLDTCLVWHLATQQWGVATYALETTCFFVPASTTFDNDTGTFDAAVGTFDSEPPSKKLVAGFSTAHKLGTLTGIPGTSMFTTADKGDNVKASRLTESYVSYAVRPTTAQCAAYSATMLGGTELTGPTSVAFDDPGSSSTPGRFTLRSHARWHRLEYTFTGACRITDEGAKLTPSGSR